jgi:uncharacterized protein (DUF58 family)
MAHTAAKIRRYFDGRIKQRNPPGNPQTAHSRNLYILPSGFGWIYGLVVVGLFFGATNYQINTIFFMTFLLAAIGLASAFEAHANLKNLSFKLIAIEDAQQGTPAKMTLFIDANHKTRFGIEFQIASQPKIRLEKIPPEGLRFVIPIETQTRGYFALPRITIASLYPFGIFGVWSYAAFTEHYYVYPQPVNPDCWPEPYIDQETQKKFASGDEEFYDLKQVENPWIEPNRIAWKIAAKNQGWYLQTMHSNEADYFLFKLSDLTADNLELKLQHLSYWLQTAEAMGLIYGLALTPSSKIQFAHGKIHLQQCLRQLALYQ